MAAGGVATVALIAWWLTPTGADAAAQRFFLWAGAIVGFAAATWRPRTRGRADGVTVAATLLIAIALLPRLIALDVVPFAVTFDEALHPLFGRDVLRTNPWSTFEAASSYFATPHLDFVVQGWPTLFLPGLLGGRFASVTLALVSLGATYALGRRLFGPRAALAALVVLSVSHWHVLYSRLAHPYMQPMALVPLALLLAVRSGGARRDTDALAAGLLLGFSVLVYTPARIVIPILGAWWLLAWIGGRARPLAGVLIAGGALLGALPYLRAQGVGAVLTRYREASAPTAGDGLTALWQQTVAAGSIYFSGGAWLAPHDPVSMPLLDITCAILTVIGLGLCLRRPLAPGPSLVLLWVGGTFVAGQVLTDLPIAAYRAAPLLPALALATGFAFDRVLGLIAAGVREPWQVNFVALATYVAVAAPWHFTAGETYSAGRAHDMVTALSRFAASMPPTAHYYIVAPERVAADERFRLIAGDNLAEDVPSPMDLLGHIDPATDAVLVWHSQFAGFESAVRRCYPQADVREREFPTSQRIRGAFLSQALLAQQPGCATQPAHGLTARYYATDDWSGPPILERVEDWPARWGDTVGGVRFGSVEWTGRLTIPANDRYLFSMPGRHATDTLEIGTALTLRGGSPETVELQRGKVPIRLRCHPRPKANAICLVFWERARQGIAALAPRSLHPH